MKKLAVVNQKGGVGKTTTAVQTASYLAKTGNRVLSVDLDAQANLTSTMFGGSERDETKPTVYDVLVGKARISEAIAEVDNGWLLPAASDIACSDKRLAAIDAEIGNKPNRYYLLKEALEAVDDLFDYVVMDTPPAADTCSYNALTAADRAIIVTEASEYSLRAINDLSESIGQIRKYTNPGLEIAGVLVTKCEGQTILARAMCKGAAEIAEALGTTTFQSRIRKAVAIGESQAQEQSIFDYAPESDVAKDYQKFIEELTKGF